MKDKYITPISKHSALLILDVQRDFTLKGGGAEIPGTLQAVRYIKPLVEAYRKELSNSTCHKAVSCRWFQC
jgi:hypothetical protein